MSNLYLDIGGSGVQYQIGNNEVLSFSTAGLNKIAVLKKIAKIANQNVSTNIVISSPGACNPKTGWIDGISGIKDYGNFNLYDELIKLLKDKNTKLYVSNDANMALYSNLNRTDYKNAVQITIGTGIGGAFSIDGKIVYGKNGYAGEFGYSLNFFNNKNLSEEISANALVKMFNGKYKNAKEIFLNEKSSHLLSEWFNKISIFLINLQYTFDPEVIFISGGLTQNPLFSKTLKSCLKVLVEKQNSITLLPNVLVSNKLNSGIDGCRSFFKSL